MVRLFTRRPWALYNPLKSWTLAGLSLRECQVLVASMSDAEMKVSWAYKSRWSDWKPLGNPDCHSLFLFKDPKRTNLPTVPDLKQEDDHEITQVRTLSAPAGRERVQVSRKHQRYIAELQVEIMVGSQRFSTVTTDLSEGGFLFQDPLPDWVAGYFTVVLNSRKKKFEFTCCLAEDQKKEKFRTEISPMTSEKQIRAFRHWLGAQKFPVSEQTTE
jgi:hypothetical protein